ncbi:hypothetical protein N1031_06600 [Herbiconiux moechotypicola]|uniref:Uncharacterized protein n=1 Tax=Herbiconiux moechotypicola TaxID=637393 RepID=A0ABN3DFH6_9MICO|nr:hypothetical protein [Herbiconiux moechotypicola]MCS5729427.1 hypothetical protein [Herbiconiux moechotypicola]
MTEPTITPRSMLRTPDPHPHRPAAAVEAAEVSELARHRDPSLTDAARTVPRRGSGVEWVRPSDLLVSRSARIAGRGIDFQAELARRTRSLPVHAARATGRSVQRLGAGVSDGARRLPPVSAFGQGATPSGSPVSRSGIGLG